jgi:hypothetical protein
MRWFSSAPSGGFVTVTDELWHVAFLGSYRASTNTIGVSCRWISHIVKAPTAP